MKNLPEVSVDIRVECPLYPSEDPSKVVRAIKNVISNCAPEIADSRVRVLAKSPEVLGIIYEQIRSRATMGVFRRILFSNKIANSTWFYLNKQAAYAGAVSICEEESESPLGPIKVTITSNQIESIINWLVSF